MKDRVCPEWKECDEECSHKNPHEKNPYCSHECMLSKGCIKI